MNRKVLASRNLILYFNTNDYTLANKQITKSRVQFTKKEKKTKNIYIVRKKSKKLLKIIRVHDL